MVFASRFLGKIARYPLKVLPGAMTVPVLGGVLRGTKWIVGSQRHSFWLGNYEPFLQKRMAQEVVNGGVFYDVGANVGFYSLLASSLIGSGKVFAFEPWPVNVQFLRKHLTLNNVKNVETFEIAISDQVGTAFFHGEETGAMGRLETTGSLRVATSTLDSLIQEQSVAPPDCIKMDIEGGEYRALVGAANCFRRYRPKLFLATHGCRVHDECCRLLRAWGYELEFLSVEGNNERADIFAKVVW